jgi:hypothetical protein
MLCTQSNVFERGSLIAWGLPRSSNLEERIASLEVDRVVRVDSLQVHDVLQIPTDEHIDSGDRGKSDVQGVRAHVRPDGAILNVGSCKLLGLSGERKALDVRRWNLPEGPLTRSGAVSSSRTVSSDSARVSSPR